MRKFKMLLAGAALVAVLAATQLPAKADRLSDVVQAGIMFVFIDSDPAPAPSFRATIQDATALTTYTYNTVDFNTAHSLRVIAVIFYASGSPSTAISSCTIGGVAATLAVTSGATARSAEIWYAAVPTGATGTIAVTWAGAQTGCIGHVFALYPSSPTPVDAVGNNASATSVVISNLAKTSGGFALFGTNTNSADSVVLTGTGGETITEGTATTFDSSITVTPHYFVVTATSTTDDYTATFSGADAIALVGATWV